MRAALAQAPAAAAADVAIDVARWHPLAKLLPAGPIKADNDRDSADLRSLWSEPLSLAAS